MEQDESLYTKIPKCIATTGSTYQCSITESRKREAAKLNQDYEFKESSIRPGYSDESNVFKSAEWYVESVMGTIGRLNTFSPVASLPD